MTRKLRPYDQPPRRKRTLIPSAPDSAAGLFLVVAILWLLAAAGLGILAAGTRLFPDLLKVSFSVPLGSGIEVDITRTTMDPAFIDALVFGWLTNAAFGAIFFVTPRLTGARLKSDAVANLGDCLYQFWRRFRGCFTTRTRNTSEHAYDYLRA